MKSRLNYPGPLSTKNEKRRKVAKSVGTRTARLVTKPENMHPLAREAWDQRVRDLGKTNTTEYVPPKQDLRKAAMNKLKNRRK